MTLRNLSDDMPSVTFNFEGAKKLDGRITFTRASYADDLGDPINEPNAGTGTSGGKLQEFNINVPRLTDKGLLIEESRTNTITTSQDLPSWYTSSTGSWTQNSGVAPDGTTTADLFTEGTATGKQGFWHGGGESLPLTDHSYSIFLKPNGRTWVKLRLDRISNFKGAFFNLSGEGSIGTVDTDYTAYIQKLSNGWYRCLIKAPAIGATDLYPATYCATGDGTLEYLGDGTSGVYAWGAQLEEGSFPTSYIPTNGAEVTRAADLCQITGDDFSSWYRNFLCFTASGEFVVTGIGGVIASFENPGSRPTNFTKTGTPSFRLIRASQPGYTLDVPVSAGVDFKAGVRSNYGDMHISANGFNGNKKTNLNNDNTRTCNGLTFESTALYLKYFAYYPVPLSDSALGGLAQ